MRRFLLLAVVVVLALLGAACVPPDPGPSGLYRGVQATISPVVTPKDQPVTWGAAPVIDESYGGTLYAGTPSEIVDPRPALLPGGLEPLRLWVADPRNALEGRPAIVWLHGGGFAVGIDSMHQLANSTAKEYAQRGYVGFSVEYSTDTTIIGTKSLCQWVQDNEDPTSELWLARRSQCARNIIAAQRDAQAAVRWIRAHADDYGVDPGKVAVGGFSAGAVTAANLAYRSDDVGTISYFEGDDLSVARSKVQAAFGASGCAYPESLGVSGTPVYIDAGDGPVSLVHAEIDGAVPYECAATTVKTARSKGLVAELQSYCDEQGHAMALYRDHKAATDEQWTTFLARELRLYTGIRPPSADPTCDQR